MIDNLTLNYDNSNQLHYINDAIANSFWSSLQDSKDYTTGTGVEYTYNTNGSMTKDLNKGISAITYNILNLPRQIDIKHSSAEARDEYVYSAGGQKLKVIQKWNPSYSTTPVVGTAINTSALTITKTTDYIGNKIYENGTLKMIRTDNGYFDYSTNKYYFYTRYHLGNNRVVADKDAAVTQSTQYYPFGMAFATSTGQNVQAFKYNDKELDLMHNLNMYDYSARYIDMANPRFTTIDPLAEKYYSVSPYAYCKNNPVNRIDPDGRDDYYYNEKGLQLYRLENQNPDRNYLIKTTQTTDVMYGKDDSEQKGKSRAITSEAAATAESEISAGNLTGDHMKNVVQIQSTDKMEAMVNSIKDDATGGTNVANNKEYSGSFGGENGVYNTKESASGKPKERKPLVTTGTNDFHSHPSGTEKFTENGKSYTGSWQQPPSKQDISVAGSKNQYVVGMGNGTIYIYNKNGVVATIPLSTFKK